MAITWALGDRYNRMDGLRETLRRGAARRSPSSDRPQARSARQRIVLPPLPASRTMVPAVYGPSRERGGPCPGRVPQGPPASRLVQGDLTVLDVALQHRPERIVQSSPARVTADRFGGSARGCGGARRRTGGARGPERAWPAGARISGGDAGPARACGVRAALR